MSVPLPPRTRPLLRTYARKPYLTAARLSPAMRRWCDRYGYITPHFTWASYACTDGMRVPDRLRPNAIRLHWKLELMRHRMGNVAMTVDGPYRTPAKNRAVGGASNSRHTYADAADFFAAQVDRWVRQSPTLRSKGDVVRIADRTFKGVGNETSGTLHVDERPGPKVRFVTWVAGR